MSSADPPGNYPDIDYYDDAPIKTIAGDAAVNKQSKPTPHGAGAAVAANNSSSSTTADASSSSSSEPKQQQQQQHPARTTTSDDDDHQEGKGETAASSPAAAASELPSLCALIAARAKFVAAAAQKTKKTASPSSKQQQEKTTITNTKKTNQKTTIKNTNKSPAKPRDAPSPAPLSSPESLSPTSSSPQSSALSEGDHSQNNNNKALQATGSSGFSTLSDENAIVNNGDSPAGVTAAAAAAVPQKQKQQPKHPWDVIVPSEKRPAAESSDRDNKNAEEASDDLTALLRRYSNRKVIPKAMKKQQREASAGENANNGNEGDDDEVYASRPVRVQKAKAVPVPTYKQQIGLRDDSDDDSGDENNSDDADNEEDAFPDDAFPVDSLSVLELAKRLERENKSVKKKKDAEEPKAEPGSVVSGESLPLSWSSILEGDMTPSVKPVSPSVVLEKEPVPSFSHQTKLEERPVMSNSFKVDSSRRPPPVTPAKREEEDDDDDRSSSEEDLDYDLPQSFFVDSSDEEENPISVLTEPPSGDLMVTDVRTKKKHHHHKFNLKHHHHVHAVREEEEEDVESEEQQDTIKKAAITSPEPVEAPPADAAESPLVVMQRGGFPTGLSQALLDSKDKYPCRFWILDNCAEMSKQDSRRVVRSGNANTFELCSRWTELQQTIRQQIRLSSALEAPTTFRLVCFDRRTTNEFTLAVPSSPEDGSLLLHRDEALATFESMKPLMEVPRMTQTLAQGLLNVRLRCQPAEDQPGRRAVVIVAVSGLPVSTRGEGTSGAWLEFVQGCKRLQELGAWIVIRLCTRDAHVVDSYHGLKDMLEMPVEILEEYIDEAKRIHKANAWLNYTLPMHRSREIGYHHRTIDLLKRRRLTKDELVEFLGAIFGDEALHEVPDINTDWDGFLEEVKTLVMKEGKFFNPITKKIDFWVDLSRLEGMYGRRSMPFGHHRHADHRDQKATTDDHHTADDVANNAQTTSGDEKGQDGVHQHPQATGKKPRFRFWGRGH